MPLEYLRHILDECNYLVATHQSVTRQAFFQDPTLRRAFVRSIEVIGEATKKIPGEFRAAHPEIDWKAMAGMRDRLIHDYLGTDYELVWDVVIHKVPLLKKQIQAILQEGDETSS